MKSFAKAAFLKDENGQVLPWMALLMVVFLGLAGLTIDLGRGWMAYSELQAASDAAALAGVNAMTAPAATASSVASAVCQFSANTNSSNNCTMITTGTGGSSTTTTMAGNNSAPGLGSVTTTATMKCVTGLPYVPTACDASNTGYNVIQVQETTTIPTFFIQALGAFGIKTGNSLTMNTASSATLSGSMAPLDVAILIDTTASMGQQDPNCGNITKEQCALNGVQGLLAALPQCAEVSPVTGNCIAYNKVSLFTFPNVAANTVTDDTTCQTGKKPTKPSVVSYTWPATLPAQGDHSWTAPSTSTNTPTYQITGFSDDYYDSYNSSTQQNNLSTSSGIVIATGGTGTSTCDGLQAPGGVQTYYAGAINVAQEALMAAANNTNSKMVMIILSDGAANSPSIASPAASGYGSKIDECQQAIYAANNATNLGTTVYTIAYDSATSGCTTDNSNSGLSTTNSAGVTTSINRSGISPCKTMQYMSSGYPADTSHFYSDGGSATVCGVAGGGPSDLPTIFREIETSFGTGRLIPNS
ncbi:MAG: pilus assembly protein TadG-related protein [Terracidiphilus sp.]